MKKAILLFFLVIGMFLTNTKTIGENIMSETQEVRASHILVNTEKEAQDLKNKIENKEMSFEEAAMQYSSCPSKRNGGDLGYFPRGVMVKEFENAAFEGNVNEVSSPIQTQFGWHLIKVVDKK